MSPIRRSVARYESPCLEYAPRAVARLRRIKSLALALAAICLPFGVAAQTATPGATTISAGSTTVGVAAASTTVTFNITTGGTLGNPLVVTTGIPNLDFTLGAGNSCTGVVTTGTCTVNVAFTPTAPGVRLGAVELTNSAGAVIATQLVYGAGIGPLPTFTPGTITTLAGNGMLGYSGDNVLATSAEITPSAVAVDAQGNLYIADAGNYRIRKVAAATGIITTIAGDSVQRYDCTAATSGDNGPATNAIFNSPGKVVIDGAGNLYFPDCYYIRKITAATGIITTVAGAPSWPGSCTGQTNTIGDGCAATSVQILLPESLAIDVDGNLYIADGQNNSIRKIDATTGIITTIAGGGSSSGACTGTTDSVGDGCTAISAQLRLPEDVTVDAAGDLYIADEANFRIRKVAAVTGIITTVAGNGTQSTSILDNIGDNGPATSAELGYVDGVEVDPAGNIYIADNFLGGRIREVSAATGIIAPIAGSSNSVDAGDNGPATSAGFDGVQKIAFDGSGNLYISNTCNCSAGGRIREVSAAASLSFSSTAVGLIAPAQTVSLNDNGNATLILPVPSSGTDPAPSIGFTVAGASVDPCPQLTSSPSAAATLSSGASCTEAIGFAPVQAGSITGALVTTGKNAAATGTLTQSIALSGVATQGTPTVAVLNISAYTGTTVTLTAVIAGTGVAPGGPVSFSVNGDSAIASTCVAETDSETCTASYPTTSLTVGYNYAVSAAYTADANYLAASSTGTLTIDDFNLAISTSSGSSTSQTIAPGGTATYNFALSPAGTSTFPAPIVLAASGLPAGASYTITPTTIAAGAATTNISLTISAPQQTASLDNRPLTRSGLASVALCLFLLPLSRKARTSARKLHRTVALLLLVASTASVIAISGCQSSNGPTMKPAQTYTLTLTGSSGTLSHSTTVTLTVQ